MSSPHSRLFIVREAVLVTQEGRSAWSLTFAEQAEERSGETIILIVSPEKIDDLYFAKLYTRDEIEALENGG